MKPREKSPKSYAVAVSLAGIFGTLGIHHFYTGNYVHGLFDVGLVGLTIYFYLHDQILMAAIPFVIDVLHTLYVFFKLIVEQETDGKGRVITIG